MTITRLAVVNRGVPAVRLIRAAREYGDQRGRAIRTIVVHPDEERGSLAVREADESVAVGRALTDDEGADGDLQRLAAALTACAADAVWVGWGPLAGRPELAALCERLGLTLLGPSAATLEALADHERMDAVAAGLGLPRTVGGPRAPGTRHVDVLVVADRAGTTWPVGLLDGTVQRRGEKVLTESPPAWLDAETAGRIGEAAVAVMRAVDYVGAGTVSFLVSTDDELTLQHASVGLPLGHPVTELCAPVDLATLQLRIAEGELLEPTPPYGRGHALAVRLRADETSWGSAHAGRVALFRPPTGPGLRIDAGVAEGDRVAPAHDTTIAEVAAWGADRDEARSRLRRALAELPVVIEGGISTKGVLLELLDRNELRTGDVDTRWLDTLSASGALRAERHADVAVVVAAIDAYDQELQLELRRFLAAARRGRPATRSTVGVDVELEHRGVATTLRVARTGPSSYSVRAGGRAVTVDVERLDAFQSRVRIGDRQHRVVSAVSGTDHVVEVDGVPHRIARDDHGVVSTPVPGVVVALPVEPGQPVEAGDTVAVVENMKMESAVRAPVAGRVREVLTGVNVQVDPGTPLVRLDPRGGPLEADGAPVSLPESAVPAPTAPSARCLAALDVLENLVLGFEVAPATAREAADDLARGCAAAGEDAAVLERELALLATYADVHWPFRDRRDPDDPDPRAHSPHESLLTYLRATDAGIGGLPPRFAARLQRALGHYGATPSAGGPTLDRALYWMQRSHGDDAVQAGIVAGILRRWLEHPGRIDAEAAARARVVLGRLVSATVGSRPVVADLAREVAFRLVDEPLLTEARRRVRADAEATLAAIVDEPEGPERSRLMAELVACPHPLAPLLLPRMSTATAAERRQSLEVMTRRYHRGTTFRDVRAATAGTAELLSATVTDDGTQVRVLAAAAPLADLGAAATALAAAGRGADPDAAVQVDLYTWADDEPDLDALAESVPGALAALQGPGLQHAVLAISTRNSTSVRTLTFRPGPDGTLAEDRVTRGLHPMMARRLHLWRLSGFDLTRLPAAEGTYLFHGVARENPKDERLFAVGEVRFLTLLRDAQGRVTRIPQLEDAVTEAFEGIRRFQAPLPPERRLLWNRVLLYVWPPVDDLDRLDLERVARGLAPSSAGLGLEEVVVHVNRTDPATGRLRQRVLHLGSPTGSGFVLTESDPPTVPLAPLDEYTRKVVSSRRRGAVYPYELVTLLVSPGAGGRAEVTGGSFVEYDLDDDGALVPVDRAPGRNRAGLVVGVVSSTTARHPEGMRRVALLGDPTKALGSLAEPECRRIMAALDLAEEMDVPLEWYAISAGARIAMDSGTENMDWIADVLRRIIEFTQRGHELNVVVTGINVGAQPYWNAEATMLMHTKGILVMTPSSAMVLTGKQALDYSGSVSADDNFGIGGYERVMGPNGQAQYWAPNIAGAVGVLLAHYDHTYVVPGERFPRIDVTTDPIERDVRPSPHTLAGSPLRTVGDVMSDDANPGRKLPFDIRSVMRAVIDADHPPLERWPDMADADTVVVWDAHLGGRPVCLLGIEGHAMQRRGAIPADGPDQWTSGTLFPMSSKKTARAVNAASGNRPLVVLANLSGFDGSPESMRKVQLEYGAEIGRAVVNFDGPIVFCVVSRYHGGAFVVFSQKLNPNLETIAVEGSHASVIGGTPAAAVVFAGEVKARTRADERVVAAQARVEAAEGADRAAGRAELTELTAAVTAEKIGEIAAEFDGVHDVERARDVGSVSRIVPAAQLRPVLVEAVERGVRRHEDGASPAAPVG